MRTLDQDILELIAAANPGPAFLSDVMQAFPDLRPVEVYQRIHALKNEHLIADGFVHGRIPMALTVEGMDRLRELKGALAGGSLAQETVQGSCGAEQANSTGEFKIAPEPIGHRAQDGRQSTRREGFGCSAGLDAGAPKPGVPPYQLADRAREVPAKPPLGQAPPDGNGAHSAPSQPFAECAPECLHVQSAQPSSSRSQSRQHRPGPKTPEAVLNEFASAALPPATGNEALARIPLAATLASAHAIGPAGALEDQHRGATVFDIDEIVNRVLAANRVIERISQPCPQGEDCAGDGKHTRIFECEEGCGFRGCVVCLLAHEAEPHWSDSKAAREMYALRMIR